MVITSAGCNVLDYLLAGVQHIDAVDINPYQNALLELKISGIKNLDYDAFFKIFGKGVHPHIRSIYMDGLRQDLSKSAREFWDRKFYLFSGLKNGGTFYFSGPCGILARMINAYIDHWTRLRPEVVEIFSCQDLASQEELYNRKIKDKFWGGFLRWLAGRDFTLALLGVPLMQRRQIEKSYPGGVSAFIQSRLSNVFTKIPLTDNYHWRIYLFGCYSTTCCPEYLKPDNFERLKKGLISRVDVHTCTVSEFLLQSGSPINKFVLLDHMDWLADDGNEELSREWQGIVNRSAPESRVIWRSGGMETDFVNKTQLHLGGKQLSVGDLLEYQTELANQLHPIDRVQTYASFHIADLKK
jgi:S-adenosylmethionine-diacylglycerol 3-amino-3-carboxypropyl transferase